jgi:tyrosinase
MGLVNSSVNDPVFWMHHANVDRLWCQWQDIYPTYLHHMPTSGAPMGQNTLDSMPPFGVTPCDATNMVAMNYEYDDCVGPCTYDPGHAYAGQTYSQVLMKAMI